MVNSQFISVQSATTKGKFERRLLKDTLYVSHYGLKFPKNHFLYETISHKIRHLKACGIIDYWTSEWLKSRYDSQRNEPSGAKVLSMNHLSIGFEVWLVMLCLSLVVFVLENLVHQCLTIFNR